MAAAAASAALDPSNSAKNTMKLENVALAPPPPSITRFFLLRDLPKLTLYSNL